MRFTLILSILPFLSCAQLNQAFVVKSNLNYNKLEYKGQGLFGFEMNDKFGYIDKNGNVIIPGEYSYKLNNNAIPYFYSELIALKKGDKMGIIDKTGKTIIPFEYDNISVEYRVKDAFPAGKKENGKFSYGVINAQNKSAIPLTYEELFMDSNLVKVRRSGKYTLLDISGRQVLPDEYDAITTYTREKLIVVMKGDQLKFFNPGGTLLFEKAKNVYTITGCADGMIRCKVNDKYGFLDLKGNEVIVTRYDDANDFVGGLAKVGKKSASSGSTLLYGFVDKKGTEVIPLIYPSANLGAYQVGLIKAKDPETNRWGYYDKTGKWVLQPTYLEATNSDNYGGLWVKTTDGKYHYINKAGKEIGTVDSKASIYYFFGESGFAVYEDPERSYILMDKNAKAIKVIEDCDGIYAFVDDIAGFKCKSNGKYGFLDLNGNKITACDFDGFAGFSNDMARVDKKVDGKTKQGYIDKKGNIVLPVVYESVGNFIDGWGIIRKDSNYFFVDRNGSIKDPPRKYDELYDFKSGFARGIIKGKNNNPNTYYYINKDLKEELTISSKEAYSFWDDVAVIKRDKEYELMNKKGEIVKSLGTIDVVKFSVEGLLAIRNNGKWGYINNRGDLVIATKYDSCDVFKHGFARVRMGNKWGIIDRTGTQIIESKYESIFPGENGIFIFYENGSWGVIDKTGKVIAPPTFSSITSFENDRALARTGKTFTILKSPLAK